MKKIVQEVECIMLGCLGADKYGEFGLSVLKQENINTNLLSLLEGHESGICYCPIFEKERSLISQIDASKFIPFDLVKKNKEIISECDIVVIEAFAINNSKEIIEYVMNLSIEKKKLVAFSLSSEFMVKHQIKKISEVCLADIIFGNIEEYNALIEDLVMLVRRLTKKF